MTRLFFFLTTFIFVNIQLHAQSTVGTIKGTITTSDGSPAPYVSIKIERSKWGSTSNEKGVFVIDRIKPGRWIIKVSAVSTASQEKEVTLEAGQTLQVDFVLKENTQQLQNVIVTNRNLNKENKIVAKMPLTNLENPQVYNSVSSEILKQQAVTNYDDAMRNVPGIFRTWESTGRSGDGASYFALRGFDAQPTLYNGLPGITSGSLDPADIEEIEVIKGPSGTLFGGSFYSYGGIINTITKKPYFKTGGEIGYNVGSFGLNRFTVDFNTPLSKKEKIALRVNAAYHTEKSFQDAGFKKSFFIAPSLTYEVNNRLSFQFLAEVLEENRAVAPVFFQSDRYSPLDFKTVGELNLNNDLSFTSNDLTIKNPRYNLQAQMLYKLSDKWTSQTIVSNGKVKSKGIYTYIWDDVAGDNYFSQWFHNENQSIVTTDVQQNFNGDFKIGGLRNRLLIGLDYMNRRVSENGSGWAWARSVTPQGGINYVYPFSGDTMPPVYMTKASVDALLAATPGDGESNVRNNTYSAYVSDVLNITPSLMAMISLRGDYYDTKSSQKTADENYNQFVMSPKFGLVYQPILNKVSIFANYMDAFINVAPIPVIDKDSNQYYKTFKPEHATQLEYGVKANLFSNKLNATLSVYDIRVRDRVVGVPGNVNDYTQGGKVRSKGFEVDVKAYPAIGLSIMAGYSYNDIRVVEGNGTDFYAEQGRSPGGQGPQNLVNLWASYTLGSGKLKNLGFGIGGNYASKYKVIDNSVTGLFYLPAYTLVNGTVFYDIKKIRIACNVNNITNEVYYIGYWSINPQKPRNFVVSVAYKF